MSQGRLFTLVGLNFTTSDRGLDGIFWASDWQVAETDGALRKTAAFAMLDAEILKI